MSNAQNPRVVVTGLGVISSLGLNWQDFWINLISGKSGISEITSFDTSGYNTHLAGEVKNFRPQEFIDKRKIPKMGRASQMAIAACQLALKDANFPMKEFRGVPAGVCIGTTMGESQVIETNIKGMAKTGKIHVRKKTAFAYPSNMIGNNIAAEFKLNKACYMFANACAAGNFAISYAYDLIQAGKASAMFAGGVDALSRIAFTGFSRLYAMAPDKCQPFDKNRQGMMLGEGAGILFLETFENAMARHAKIYSEILGYGLSCDASHMTIPTIAGVEKAVRKALKNSNVSTDQVDYVSAHGTGTIENDKAECAALKRVFGKRLKDIPVSSIKSMLGHTMGAASAFEAIACCLAIQDKKIPPTINLEEQDPECDIDGVPNKSRNLDCKLVLNNSLAFGGNNGCVVLKANEERSSK